MAKQVPYEVIDAITGRQLTEWSEMTPVHYYSTKANGVKTSFLHLDKTQPQVADLLQVIRNAQAQLWDLHNQSPTSLQGKDKVTEKVTASVQASIPVMEDEAPL